MHIPPSLLWLRLLRAHPFLWRGGVVDAFRKPGTPSGEFVEFCELGSDAGGRGEEEVGGIGGLGEAESRVGGEFEETEVETGAGEVVGLRES